MMKWMSNTYRQASEASFILWRAKVMLEWHIANGVALEGVEKISWFFSCYSYFSTCDHHGTRIVQKTSLKSCRAQCERIDDDWQLTTLPYVFKDVDVQHQTKRRDVIL